MNRIVTGTLALAAGTAIGWFSAPMGEPSHAPTTEEAALRAESIREKLARAGAVLDAEQRSIDLRSALAGAEATDMEPLAPYLVDFADRRPDMPLREEFLRRWGELEPRTALAWLGPDANTPDRKEVLRAWGRTNPDQAADRFLPTANVLSDATRPEARALLAGIAEADAAKALRFADRFALADLDRLEFKHSPFVGHPTFRPEGAYQESLDSWIRHHPADAFEAMMTLNSPKVRQQALNELFNEWLYVDPEGAQAAADRLWEHSQRKIDAEHPLIGPELMNTLFSNHGEAHGREAVERAFIVGDPDLREVAIKAALDAWNGWDDQNLSAVADFVATRLRNSDHDAHESIEPLTQAAVWTGQEMAGNDSGIEAAAAWLKQLPPGAARNAAIKGMISVLDRQPAKQAAISAWVNTLPPSPERDATATEFASVIAAKDPEAALNMTGIIEDSALRAEVLVRAGARFIPKHEGGTKRFDLRTWMLENPGTAEELRAAAGAW